MPIQSDIDQFANRNVYRSSRTPGREVVDPYGGAVAPNIDSFQDPNAPAYEPSPYVKALQDMRAQIDGVGPGGGMSEWDLLQAIATGAGSSPSGGSSSGGGRGGSGGGSGVNPSLAPAYQQYLASIQGQDIQGRFDGLRDRLGSQYSDDPVNNRYDQFLQAIQQAAGEGNERVAGIGAEMAARAAQGRTDVSEAFGAGDARLQALQQQFSQGSEGNAAGLNNILNSFDAGSVEAQQAPLNNLFAAAQAAQTGNASTFDAALADRASLGGALQGDVQTGISQGEQALMTRIAADRQAGLQANDAARAKLDAELFIQQQQAEQAQIDAENQVRLQMAQLGING